MDGFNDIDGRMLGRAARSCSRREIIAVGSDMESVAHTIEELFLFPRPLLTKIVLDLNQRRNSRPVLEKLGDCARCFREFKYYGCQLEDGAFERIEPLFLNMCSSISCTTRKKSQDTKRELKILSERFRLVLT